MARQFPSYDTLEGVFVVLALVSIGFWATLFWHGLVREQFGLTAALTIGFCLFGIATNIGLITAIKKRDARYIFPLIVFICLSLVIDVCHLVVYMKEMNEGETRGFRVVTLLLEIFVQILTECGLTTIVNIYRQEVRLPNQDSESG